MFDIFLDQALTQKVDDFDMETCEVGMRPKVKSFWLKNISDYIVKNFRMVFDDKSQFRVLECPETFKPGEAKEIKIEAEPALSIHKPFKSKCKLNYDVGSGELKWKMKLELPEQQRLEELVDEFTDPDKQEERHKKLLERMRNG